MYKSLSLKEFHPACRLFFFLQKRHMAEHIQSHLITPFTYSVAHSKNREWMQFVFSQSKSTTSIWQRAEQLETKDKDVTIEDTDIKRAEKLCALKLTIQKATHIMPSPTTETIWLKSFQQREESKTVTDKLTATMNGAQVPMVNALSKATTISDRALLYPQILTFSWEKQHAHSHLQHAEDKNHFTIGAITAKPKNQENFHRPSIRPCLVPLPITSRHKPICWLQHNSSHLTCKLTYTQRHALHAMRRGGKDWAGGARRRGVFKVDSVGILKRELVKIVFTLPTLLSAATKAFSPMYENQ